MSYEVVLRPTQSRAKVRNPWGVLGLSIITLGIYVPFWSAKPCRATTTTSRAGAVDPNVNLVPAPAHDDHPDH